jgi:hypothetical protein
MQRPLHRADGCIGIVHWDALAVVALGCIGQRLHCALGSIGQWLHCLAHERLEM